ncbi:hypothetical protein [Oryza sativa Japonica Group]|uniref:Uncharacterized protein n=3 Tax=Oryza TaxID=4527 RepID=A2ZWC7_ORYSJ|nr:hypothetical protein OsJ_02945 [Oryza sativa Japonica Group]BAD73650.1 hypothetical protein [Oryza sativa Japonica Group]
MESAVGGAERSGDKQEAGLRRSGERADEAEKNEGGAKDTERGKKERWGSGGGGAVGARQPHRSAVVAVTARAGRHPLQPPTLMDLNSSDRGGSDKMAATSGRNHQARV